VNTQEPGALPVFSPRLDEVLGLMINGEIPNVGRFCGYCYTPVAKKADVCAYCGRTTAAFPPVDRIPSEVGAIYRRMRKRESLIVNSFAFTGLGLGLVLFTFLVWLAVYHYDANLWLLAAATAVFIIGGRVFAGLLGGWIGDNLGYEYAQRKLAEDWAAYEATRGSAPEVTPRAGAPSAPRAG
jgi:hypothetical protein